MADRFSVGDIITMKKTASVRQQRLGGPACRSGFPAEMRGVRASDYGSAQAG